MRVGNNGGALTIGSDGRVLRGVGPVAVERSHLHRVAHLLLQTQGRDVGSAAKALEER